MSDFGALLKQAREDRGKTLRQIATSTKISMVALEALERGDFSRLPGGIFSRAFVRAYALEVGLDPEQTVATFIEEYDKALSMRAERVIRPEVTADDREFLERQHRAATILRWSLVSLALIAVIALVMWQLRASGAAGAAPPPGPPVAESMPTTPEAQPASPVADPAQPVIPSPAPGAPTNQTLAAAATGAPTPAAATSTQTEADSISVHLGVTADCWVRARVDGAVIFAQILHAGEQRDVKPGRDVLIEVGNAGAIQWTINGQQGLRLGRFGQTGSAHLTKATLGQYVQ